MNVHPKSHEIPVGTLVHYVGDPTDTGVVEQVVMEAKSHGNGSGMQNATGRGLALVHMHVIRWDRTGEVDSGQSYFDSELTVVR